MQRFCLWIALMASAVLTAANAAEIKVLSAGAVEPGLTALAQQVKSKMGHDLKIQFNTAPQIAKRLAAGEAADILVSPPAAIDSAIKEGKVASDGRVPVGRVGAGVIVRSGAPAPDIATVDAFKQALVKADSVVYNTASTGLYLDKLFEKLGVIDQVKAKSARYPDGAAVMEHVIKGKGNEIGFGAITEIKMYESKGLKLVGPLPAELQNYTSYEAALMTNTTASEPAKEVLRYMATPEAKALFASRGIE
jgi:molybdate transport system substrate-binding protein